MKETEPDPIRLHPNVDQYYVHKVAELRAALNQDASRYEAAEILRTLIDEIRLHPIDGELQIELIGDLANLLGFAKEYDPVKKNPGRLGDPGRTKWLVAGGGGLAKRPDGFRRRIPHLGVRAGKSHLINGLLGPILGAAVCPAVTS